MARTQSRFQIDLSVSGPTDGTVVQKTELKVEAYEMGQTDVPPALRRQVRPGMPVRAQEEEVEGKVIVRFLVDERGRTSNIRVIKENPLGYGFAAKALEAISQYEFDPAKLRGIPVKIWVVQEIEFQLDTK
jgi:protein TonB